MIQVKDLRKLFGDLVAVDGISFEVVPDKIYGLLGPNGAGLGNRAKRPSKRFSGGMKRRLNLAIGLVHEPKVLLGFTLLFLALGLATVFSNLFFSVCI